MGLWKNDRSSQSYDNRERYRGWNLHSWTQLVSSQFSDSQWQVSVASAAARLSGSTIETIAVFLNADGLASILARKISVFI